MGVLGILAVVAVFLGGLGTAITPTNDPFMAQSTTAPVVVAQTVDAEPNRFLR